MDAVPLMDRSAREMNFPVGSVGCSTTMLERVCDGKETSMYWPIGLPLGDQAVSEFPSSACDARVPGLTREEESATIDADTPIRWSSAESDSSARSVPAASNVKSRAWGRVN